MIKFDKMVVKSLFYKRCVLFACCVEKSNVIGR